MLWVDVLRGADPLGKTEVWPPVMNDILHVTDWQSFEHNGAKDEAIVLRY